MGIEIENPKTFPIPAPYIEKHFNTTGWSAQQITNLLGIGIRGHAEVKAVPGKSGHYMVGTDRFYRVFEELSHGFPDMPKTMIQESVVSSPLPTAIEAVKHNRPPFTIFNPRELFRRFTGRPPIPQA